MENFIPLEKIVGGKGGEVKYDGRLPGAVHNGGGRGGRGVFAAANYTRSWPGA